jgi:hypothetical protein
VAESFGISDGLAFIMGCAGMGALSALGLWDVVLAMQTWQAFGGGLAWFIETFRT